MDAQITKKAREMGDIRILIVEDHMLVREGLKVLLGLHPGYAVVGDTGDGMEAEGLAESLRPDLVLLDLDLANCHGADIALRLKRAQPELKVLVLTGSLRQDSVRRALAAGADGYVVKHENSEELLRAMPAVLAGKCFISTAVAEAAGNGVAVPGILTSREREIIAHIAHGKSNQEIADLFGLSVHTVRTHRQKLMEKLDLHNAAEMTAWAIRHLAVQL